MYPFCCWTFSSFKVETIRNKAAFSYGPHMCALFVPVRYIPASGVVRSEVCVCYSAGWHLVPKFRTHKDVFFCMSVPSYNKNIKLDTYTMD